MSKLFPIIGGISGTAIIGGAGAYLISTQKAPTFKETFKEAIINFDTEKTLVDTKLEKLRGLTNLPENSRFKKAYDKEKQTAKNGFEELKEACQEIYDSNFAYRESDIFKDFQSYCARTIKDKVGEWAPSNAVWATRFSNLKKEGRKPLSKELKDIENENIADGLKLKQWCTEKEVLIFEGDGDLIYKDAKASCGKTD